MKEQYSYKCSPEMDKQIKLAVDVLKKGGTILYPTDTIWGLGCDATNAEAVAKIYEIKKRAESKSLVTLVNDMDMIGRYIKEIPQIAIELLEVNDAPMTIIYPGAIGLAKNVVAEDGTVGIRIPNNEFCKQLIFRLHRPIVSTSANISGEPSPQSFKEIPEEIKNSVDLIIDKSMEEESTHKASQIIKISLNGEITVIRK
ncbi:MAG: L-threonylcarbamoyladenylate synthase [Bacteroidales bacterium]|nr:L-threonylcarbamoyladenylate synthase [Bacteroidales bacterium]MDD3911100.1 L-threonylcarbamoyladenylate synthase [Bacteroidales bacterium]MDD4420244.1 L-threonylcarbamoyladenylate synthase [Bacteroidales bacterium]